MMHFACLERLVKKTSLRYAIQLLTPANIVAETQGRSQILPDDISQVDDLFMDGKASAQFLLSNDSAGFMS